MSPANSPESAASAPAQPRLTNVVDPSAATEFGKLVAKLRWIGSNDRANALVHYLTKVAPREIAYMPPSDTD